MRIVGEPPRPSTSSLGCSVSVPRSSPGRGRRSRTYETSGCASSRIGTAWGEHARPSVVREKVHFIVDDQVEAEVPPADKNGVVKTMQRAGRRVAMAGDGVSVIANALRLPQARV